MIGRVSELLRSLTPLLLALVALCGAPAPGHAIAGVETCTSARRNDSLFNGRPCDRFSEMINYRSRWYEPAHGRLVSTDPIGAFGDPVNLGNAYTYVGNNPATWTDPWGLQTDEFSGIFNERNRSRSIGPAAAATVAAYGEATLNTIGESAEALTRLALEPVDWVLSAQEAACDLKNGNPFGAGLTIAGAIAPGTSGHAAKEASEFAIDALRGRNGAGTEVVQRAMSRAELAATESSGLLRGGRGGTHYVSDAINSKAERARQRLALPQTPEVRVTLEVPAGQFSPPSRVKPNFNMPGGGMERTSTGDIPVRILRVDEY